MNQQRKNVPSTKKPFEVCNVAAALRGKKVKDIFVNGKFPMQLRSGNKYIMVMVEIVSNTILLEPMKSRKDAEMIWAYDVLVKRLQAANIHPRKHMC